MPNYCSCKWGNFGGKVGVLSFSGMVFVIHGIYTGIFK